MEKARPETTGERVRATFTCKAPSLARALADKPGALTRMGGVGEYLRYLPDGATFLASARPAKLVSHPAWREIGETLIFSRMERLMQRELGIAVRDIDQLLGTVGG